MVRIKQMEFWCLFFQLSLSLLLVLLSLSLYFSIYFCMNFLTVVHFSTDAEVNPWIYNEAKYHTLPIYL